MPNKNIFIGIDLGTTNSVICFGVVNPITNDIEPQVIEIDMMIAGGGKQRRELLPSCVYFRENTLPIVGDYAKSMLGRQTERVVKSVKSWMGTNKTYIFDGKTYSPSAIAALILKTLGAAAKICCGFLPEDVIITVPASFDSDQRSATIEAARLAGFRTTNANGNIRNILLDEPRAALYDFLNKHKRRKIPSVLVDFQSPKNVLVFDLGGGTLDVSIHRVYWDESIKDLKIEDYAVSRYTQIGGDNFDATLADQLIREYDHTKHIGYDTMEQIKKHSLRMLFVQYAENAKIDLSNQIRAALDQEADIQKIEAEILQTPYDNKIFEYNLTLAQYEQIIAPWLAWNLKPEDVEKIDEIQDRNNIIYPILDVLVKARHKLGNVPQVNTVLLNGGMTRLYSIQRRLHTFFGFEPIAAGDPDKAVARGATIYHYQQSMGIKTTTILNDTIGIATVRNHVEHLVEAGTVLPHKSKVYDKFVIDRDGATFLDLPFYVGRRHDTESPNRRIANRHVKFNEPLKEREPICLQVELDSMQIITLHGWSVSNPNVKFTVTVDANIQEKPAVSSAETATANKVLAPKKPPAKIILQPTKPPLDIEDSMNSLVRLCENWSRQHDPQQQAFSMKRIQELVKNILCAENRQDFVIPLIETARETSPCLLTDRILILLGKIAQICVPELKDKICIFAMSLTNPKKIADAGIQYRQQTLRYAVEAIGKTGLARASGHILQLIELKDVSSALPSIIMAVGKCCGTADAVRKINRFINDSQVGLRIAVNLALGKLGSREKEYPLEITCFMPIINALYGRLLTEGHIDAKRNAIYALGEICDRRNLNVSVVNEDTARRMIEALNTRIVRSPSTEIRHRLAKVAQLSISMISGVTLSAEQEESLLAIRTELDCIENSPDDDEENHKSNLADNNNMATSPNNHTTDTTQESSKNTTINSPNLTHQAGNHTNTLPTNSSSPVQKINTQNCEPPSSPTLHGDNI